MSMATIHQGTLVALRAGQLAGGHPGAVTAREHGSADVKNEAAYVARYTRWLVTSLVPTGPPVSSIVAVAPGIHDGLVTVAEPSHGTVTRALLPFAVTLNVPVPAVPVSQFRVIFTPPDVAAAAACGVLIAIAPATTEISPSFCTWVAPFVPRRRLFSTQVVIALVLRTLRDSVWADELATGLVAA